MRSITQLRDYFKMDKKAQATFSIFAKAALKFVTGIPQISSEHLIKHLPSLFNLSNITLITLNLVRNLLS